MQVVSVKFPESNTHYSFFVADQVKLEEGNYVVCDTTKGMQIGRVTALGVIGLKATKWIIQKIDLEAHEERLKKMLRMKELTAAIKQKVAEEREKEVLKDLGEKYPEVANMISELQSLGAELSGVSMIAAAPVEESNVE